MDAAELRAIYRIVDELPVQARIALVLKRVEGLTNREIAAHMGLSLATVKRRLSVAEDHLSDLLGSEGGDP